LSEYSSDIDLPASTGLADLMRLLPRVLGGLRRVGGPEELRTECGAIGVGPRHIGALMQLMTSGPMTVSELAARLEASLAATSLMVSELDAAGLVERHQDAADRRRTIVTVRPDARDRMAPWFARKQATFQRALDRLTAEQQAGLLAGLAAIGDELHAAAEHP
jgi:DNA-binding MarR family transcriptional regulator